MNRIIPIIFSKLRLSYLAYRITKVICPLKSVDKFVNPQKILSDISPILKNSCISSDTHKIAPSHVDLQIIIPVYNTEKYLQECLDSVLKQKTNYSFHITVIDDGSSDGCLKILDRYADNNLLTIIHQKNRGLSGARNRGLECLLGKYLMFLDSDDFLLPGAIDALMEVAIKKDYDIVQGGYYIIKNGRKHREIIPSQNHLLGYSHMKVYKSSLWLAIKFPEKYWFEDTVCHLIVYPKANRVYSIQRAVYAYRSNASGISLSSIGKPKVVDTLWITLQLLEDRKKLNLPENDEYFRSVIGQIKMNAQRISSLKNKKADMANFEISKQIVNQYCERGIERLGKDIILQSILSNDFNSFYWACIYGL